ncbi:hypothetical protein [Mesorhizobium loti]|uniref:hypothetical protein n=1 Tax=Rhizobium loti TaxID=381 RepID=UPI001FDA7B04|nr:hypothetical protein [Mesorhizobium loti]
MPAVILMTANSAGGPWDFRVNGVPALRAAIGSSLAGEGQDARGSEQNRPHHGARLRCEALHAAVRPPYQGQRRAPGRTEIIAGQGQCRHPEIKVSKMMIGGLLQATQDMQRDITEIRRDIKDSDARAALSYEQSHQRAAASRAKMYQKTDERWTE